MGGGDAVNFTDPFCLCPVCVLVSEACELGSGVYDVYQAATTLRDPNASNTEKTATVGLAAAGIFLPGGGYSAAGKVARNVDGGAATAELALKSGASWLGKGYREISPGVFRSANNKRQFRMTTSDLLDKKLGPHVHFEAIGKDGREILENSHVRIRP